MTATNHQIRLAARPVGMAKASDWKHTEEPVAEPSEGQILIKIEYISLDDASDPTATGGSGICRRSRPVRRVRCST